LEPLDARTDLRTRLGSPVGQILMAKTKKRIAMDDKTLF
jgi:hypothetical protein